MDNLSISGRGERTRLIIKIPRQVHTFLKLKGMAVDRKVEDLVLDAITSYFKLGEDA